jgi:nitroimidazol reductase NimA-like FMN-containing flavoprotein (pyridoxamine 5'-phosphate oxidase superfamily)
MAEAIIDGNLYMTLGTADPTGRPWATPVYYAVEGPREFFWVSSPEATHSRNISARPEVGIVIFDSHAVISTGQAVYMSAIAEELASGDLERGVARFSRPSEAHGGSIWTVADVASPARHRMYRATVSEHFVLDERDRRVAVALPGNAG